MSIKMEFVRQVLRVYWERHWTRKMAWWPPSELIHHIKTRKDWPRDYSLSGWKMRVARKPLKYGHARLRGGV